MMKIVKIYIPVFENRIVIYFTNDFHKAADRFSKEFVTIELSDVEANCEGLHIGCGSIHFIAIYCEELSSSSKLLNTLVHELFHAVTHLQTRHGVDCEETGAHIIGWLVEKVMLYIERKLSGEKDAN